MYNNNRDAFYRYPRYFFLFDCIMGGRFPYGAIDDFFDPIPQEMIKQGSQISVRLPHFEL